MAIRIARDAAREWGRPIGLPLSLILLPLVIEQRPDEYSEWALRWLVRWIEEGRTTIDQTADIASWLAELPTEPGGLQSIRDSAGWR